MKNSKQKTDKAKGFIKLAIKKIDIFIDERNFSEISQEQIVRFKENLQTILLELESRNMPSKENRKGWMAHVITDSWSYPKDSSLQDLSETIIQAERAYSEV